MTDMEIELAKRASHGDLDALTTLLRARSDYIYRVAYVYVGNEQDAMDVIQESTMQAATAVRKLREPQLFFTWFTRILIRQAQKIYQLRANEAPQEEAGALEPAIQADSVHHLDLLTAFTTLRPIYRQTLQLFYYQDLPVAEIGRLLNESESTIKTRLSRGREALRNILGGDYFE